MRFEEQLLTDNKADQNHSNNVSFGNCMLRIPGSLNSSQVRFDKGRIIDIPPEAEVRVIQYWDGNRPSIKPLMPRYYIWLQADIARDIDRQMEYKIKEGRNVVNNRLTKSIGWIEKLLKTPLDVEGRYYCTWRILAPYLINVKELSRSDAFEIISSWLDSVILYVDYHFIQ